MEGRKCDALRTGSNLETRNAVVTRKLYNNFQSNLTQLNSVLLSLTWFGLVFLCFVGLNKLCFAC